MPSTAWLVCPVVHAGLTCCPCHNILINNHVAINTPADNTLVTNTLVINTWVINILVVKTLSLKHEAQNIGIRHSSATVSYCGSAPRACSKHAALLCASRLNSMIISFVIVLHCYSCTFCCWSNLTAVLLHGADGQELHTHANRRAPRCLPCNYTDPAEQSFRSPPEQYPAPRVGALGAAPLPVHAGCYATHELLCCFATCTSLLLPEMFHCYCSHCNVCMCCQICRLHWLEQYSLAWHLLVFTKVVIHASHACKWI